jgi:hypothetical protein
MGFIWNLAARAGGMAMVAPPPSPPAAGAAAAPFEHVGPKFIMVIAKCGLDGAQPPHAILPVLETLFGAGHVGEHLEHVLRARGSQAGVADELAPEAGSLASSHFELPAACAGDLLKAQKYWRAARTPARLRRGKSLCRNGFFYSASAAASDRSV